MEIHKQKDTSIAVSASEFRSCTSVLESENENTGLLPRLPDEVAVLCLSRVPRSWHGILHCVCKKWNQLLSSDLIELYREIHGIKETWIYALCRDPVEQVHHYVLDPERRKWRQLPSLPDACSKRFGMTFEVLGRKLYLLGGCRWTEEATNEVYCYDPLLNNWESVANMEYARCHFVSATYNGKLYAIGGLGENGHLDSWETYDPETDKWASYEDPNIIPDVGESVAFDKRIYVRHISTNINPDPYAALYHLTDNKWTIVDNDMVKNWCGPALVMGNDVYMLDQTAGIRLMKLNKENNTWVLVGRLSPSSIKTPCRIAAIGDMLYIIGGGLQTYVVDMKKVKKESSVLVTTHIEGSASPEDIIVSCKAIAF